MGRLPFDPDRMRRAKKPADSEPSPKPLAADGVLTVSRLAALIRGVLEDHTPRKVRVVGEISGSRVRTHLYFGLKDAGAVINAVIFASHLRKLGFEPRDGLQVVATGRVEFYEPQGRVTLIAEKLEPVGAGAADLQFKQLCEELRALGWFAPERKRPLPTFPRRVAVVTSPTGAALQDVLATMAKRCPAVGVAVVPVRVQGDSAAREVVHAIDFISREHQRLGIDALIVTRGGGSPEDLAAFNEREVARAIIECNIPVVAAIGHETDTTIAELVSDERCATPTQAAMRLTPDRDALARQLDALSRRFQTDLARTLRYERQRLAAATRHPVLADPRGASRLAEEQLATARDDLETTARDALHDASRRWQQLNHRLRAQQPSRLLTIARERLETRAARLTRAASHALAGEHAHATALHERLQAIGPASVLRRGYSCTLRADGTAARDAADLAPGERLTTYLASGSVRSDVVDVSDAGLTDPPPASKPRKSPPRKPPRAKPASDDEPRTQLDLFANPE